MRGNNPKNKKHLVTKAENMNVFKSSNNNRVRLHGDRGQSHSIESFRNAGLHSTNTTSMAFKILFIVVCYCWSGVVDAARSPPPPIVVNKCCRIGEQLDTNQQCLIGSNELWWPPIFMILKQDYFQLRGDAPRFFKVRERAPPICQHIELFTGNHNIALFSNGTLYLPERKITVESDNFCVDKDVALVCFNRPQGMDSLHAPIAQPKVRKCCLNENEIYDADTSRCVPFGDVAAVAMRKLLQNASKIEYLYGFPNCDAEGYAVAGKFNESKFETTTGSLFLSEGTFRSDQYCLEHFNDSNMIEVNVMTCAKYLTPNFNTRVSNSVVVPQNGPQKNQF